MAIDFPNSPTLNQTFTVGDKVWIYNGSTWEADRTQAAVTLTGPQTLTNKSLTSPVLTGTPTAPTAAGGTNTTQIATTAFVKAEVYASLGAIDGGLASDTFDVVLDGGTA